MSIVKIFNDLSLFLEMGGDVLLVLLLVSVLFWTLVVEKFLYHRSVYKVVSKELRRFWKDKEDGESWENMQLKSAQVSELKLSLHANLSTMRVLIALFPLLGLLGTITGMISVFDSMSSLGTNAKAMASGISMATIPTMAGMLLAVLGLFTLSRTESIVKKEIRKLKDNVLKDSDA